MSRNDKPKKTAESALMHSAGMRYERFTAEPQPDRYAAPERPLYGLKAEVVADLCGVSVATVRRWKAGTSRIPSLTRAALELGLVHFIRDWPGWRFEGENLVAPDGWKVNRNHALAVPLLESHIASLKARIKELEALTDDQPVPGAYPDSITG